MSWLATAVGAAGTVMGIKGQKDAKDETLKRYQQALGAHNKQAQVSEALGQQSISQAYKGLGDIRSSYERAESYLSAQGQEGAQAIAAQQKQGVAAADAQAMNRGLYNTSSGLNMRNRETYQGMRAQGSLAERIGRLGISLTTDKGRAMAASRGQVATALSMEAERGDQTTRSLIELLGSREDVFDSSLYGNIGQATGLMNYYAGQ